MRASLRLFATLTIAAAHLPGCFVMFPMDGYGSTAAEAGAADGSTDVASPEADLDGSGADGPRGRIVFVTSSVHAGGSLQGLAGADAICAQHAAAAGLPGTYKAWLSDRDESPSTRFAAFSFDGGRDAAADADTLGPPIVLTNGAFVASGFFDLLANGPRAAITRTESGDVLAASPFCDADGGIVWTNTSRNAEPRSAQACADWQLNDNSARGGSLGSRDVQDWTDGCARACASLGRLYCFQQ